MATPVLETEIQPKIPLDPQTNEQDESYFAAVELTVSSVLPLTMKAAIELDVFNIIAREGPNGKLSASEIAAIIGTKNPDGPDMLDRILRLLASHSVLSCSVVGDGDHKSLKRLYSLTPVSKHYVTNEAGVSFGPALLMLQDKIFTESWYQMKNAIIEGGIPFEMAHGSHAFKYAGYDQRFNQAFNTGMNNITTMLVKKILEVYKGFENLKKVVDVGGGLGVAISLITATYPHIKGINYDLSHVVKDAPKYPGVEHVGGDMFASIPDADAVFMKGILHDWFDEDCIKLLKNCYKALPVDGKVIVVDAVLPSIPDSSSITKSNSHLDVHMMVQTPGGKQRSAKATPTSMYMDLATAAGFSGIKLACFAAHFGVIEFYKSEKWHAFIHGMRMNGCIIKVLFAFCNLQM